MKIFIAIFHRSGNTPKPTTGGREFTDAAPTQVQEHPCIERQLVGTCQAKQGGMPSNCTGIDQRAAQAHPNLEDFGTNRPASYQMILPPGSQRCARVMPARHSSRRLPIHEVDQ
jgi:hypothetical protein